MKRMLAPTILSLASTILFGALLYCREDNPSEDDKTEQIAPQAEQAALDYDALMTRLLELQNDIYANPTDPEFIPPLLKAAFDSTSGSFLVVGRGLANPAHPEAAQAASRKTAARHDGRRWALYLKAWRRGDMRPLSRTINGEIAYSKVLHERMRDDTLYLLLQVPLGSVVVK